MRELMFVAVAVSTLCSIARPCEAQSNGAKLNRVTEASNAVLVEPNPRNITPVCSPRLNGPGWDCDDYAYEYCKLWGLENCWILGLFWDSEHGRFQHAVPVIRREIIPGILWQFCIEEPQGDGEENGPTQIICWESENPEPEVREIENGLRAILCDFYNGWGFPCTEAYDWLMTVWYAGQDQCQFSRGEPIWYDCGSRAELSRICNELRNEGGDLACWLPYSVLPCSVYLMSSDVPGDVPDCSNANNGDMRACLNDGGTITVLQCQEGEWTPRPAVQTCSELLGQNCDPLERSAVDCSYGAIPGFGLLERTLRCVPCGTTFSDQNYCWQ